MTDPKRKEEKSESSESLDHFEIRINEFGEMISNMDVDRINAFLNKNVDDRKLDQENEEE